MSKVMNTSVANAPGMERYMAIMQFRADVSREEAAIVLGMLDELTPGNEIERVEIISHPATRKPRIIFD